MGLYNIFLNFEENKKCIPEKLIKYSLIETNFLQKIIEHLGGKKQKNKKRKKRKKRKEKKRKEKRELI